MKVFTITFIALLFISFLLIFTNCSTEIGSNDDSQKESEKLDLKPASDTTLEGFRSRGKLIVKETFLALSSYLKKAIQEGGISYALSFCNTAAIPVTDSLAELYNVDIKRVSLKNRNPLNKADAFETSLIETFSKLGTADLSQVNMVVRDAEGYAVYAQPIIINDMCLQCHGNAKLDIDPENLALIRELYPEGQAIDYKVGDLRGIWRVKFNVKSEF